MRLSRNRNWGHPETIAFIERLSREAARQPGWNGLYIGDISQPRGGPMLTGHASHQIGLDADIWMLPATNLRLSRAERESISSISLRGPRAPMSTATGPARITRSSRRRGQRPRRGAHLRLSRRQGADVQRRAGNRAYLRKIRPWWGHHYHFHVRLACPRGARGCVDQDAPRRATAAPRRSSG
jgi:penicillin-insensitive murein DD-endopeptidase